MSDPDSIQKRLQTYAPTSYQKDLVATSKVLVLTTIRPIDKHGHWTRLRCESSSKTCVRFNVEDDFLDRGTKLHGVGDGKGMIGQIVNAEAKEAEENMLARIPCKSRTSESDFDHTTAYILDFGSMNTSEGSSTQPEE